MPLSRRRLALSIRLHSRLVGSTIKAIGLVEDERGRSGAEKSTHVAGAWEADKRERAPPDEVCPATHRGRVYKREASVVPDGGASEEPH